MSMVGRRAFLEESPMKSRLAGCFLASLVCMPLSAAPSEAPPDEALIALEQKSWEAWKNRDGKFYESFLSDDHVEVGAGGVDDKAAIVAFRGEPGLRGEELGDQQVQGDRIR
jgi:hypothetical protein